MYEQCFPEIDEVVMVQVRRKSCTKVREVHLF